MRRYLSATLCVFALGAVRADEPAQKPIPGVGPDGGVTKLHTGFKFTEGPAADANGNLYFTDIPNNRIHKVDADGKLSTLLENSESCNGLMLDSRGRLIACQGGTAYAPLRRLGASGRSTIVVSGLGPVGLCTTMIGRAMARARSMYSTESASS